MIVIIDQLTKVPHFKVQIKLYNVSQIFVLNIYCHFSVFTTRRYAKRGICRRCVSVCVCVCHTPVLYQNG